MNKVLFVATVSSHILSFHVPYLKWFREQGYEVHVACSSATGYETSNDPIQTDLTIPFCDVFHNIPFKRSPLNRDNLRAYALLKDLISSEHFSIVHCHTPVGGALARLASKAARKHGTRVFYTAHGFHFYKGAPLANWLIYYPIERWLARYTDCLITINEEDYWQAVSHHFPAGQIVKLHGVGLDIAKFSALTMEERAAFRSEKRKELGLNEDDIVLLSVGELSPRKNHQIILEALSSLNSPRLKYLICGEGELRTSLNEQMEKAHLQQNVFLLGYQKSMESFYAISDIFVFPSLQEGLPVALMEAMASGLPVICSQIRGNVDLIEDGKGGFLGEANDPTFWTKSLNALIIDSDLRHKMGTINQEYIQNFDLNSVLGEMSALYLQQIK